MNKDRVSYMVKPTNCCLKRWIECWWSTILGIPLRICDWLWRLRDLPRGIKRSNPHLWDGWGLRIPGLPQMMCSFLDSIQTPGIRMQLALKNNCIPSCVYYMEYIWVIMRNMWRFPGISFQNNSLNFPLEKQVIQEKPSDLSWVEGRHFASYEVDSNKNLWGVERVFSGQRYLVRFKKNGSTR